MRTSTRLKAMQKWVFKELCEGRKMKTPAPDGDITQIVKQEPQVFVGWMPMRSDKTVYSRDDFPNVVPSITLMPAPSYVRHMEEHRFDRYDHINRMNELSQQLTVQVLFQIYEDGVRLPGFVGKAKSGQGMDMSLIQEGSLEGLSTLEDWISEFKYKLLGERTIPGTDMFLDEESATYALFSDEKYIADLRPIFVGMVNVTFYCFTERKVNDKIRKLLL